MDLKNGNETAALTPNLENIPALYERLATIRLPFLEQARSNAELTIPSAMPPEGVTNGSGLYRPFQSLGAEAVSTLAMKIVGTILPENSPMFRFSLTDEVLGELAEFDQRAEVEKKLNEIERTVMDDIEGEGTRASTIQAIEQLVISGNSLIYDPPKGGIKVFRLDKYVVQRDQEGHLITAIIKETVAFETLPESTQDLIRRGTTMMEPDPEKAAEEKLKEVDLYTVFRRDGSMMVGHQEIKGITLPKSVGKWPIDKSPVWALRWKYLDGEDYGRGHVEAYMGDLTALENLSRNIRELVAAMSKVNPMVNPTGLTRLRDIVNAENLDVIQGRADDVSMLRMEKGSDLRLAMEYMERIEMRIRSAFLMNSSAQRQAERVTAEEIRRVISDIDKVLGGVYSLLANEFQAPLVARKIYKLEKAKKIPALSKLKGKDGRPVATPRVITGVDAIGRGHDYSRYLSIMTDVIGPLKEAALQEIHVPDLLKRIFVSQSIDIDGLLKTPEDKAATEQQAMGMQQQAGMQQMLQDMVKGATPPMAQAVADGVANGVPIQS